MTGCRESPELQRSCPVATYYNAAKALHEKASSYASGEFIIPSAIKIEHIDQKFKNRALTDSARVDLLLQRAREVERIAATKAYVAQYVPSGVDPQRLRSACVDGPSGERCGIGTMISCGSLAINEDERVGITIYIADETV